MTPPSARGPIVDREASLKRLGGNEALLAKMAEFFLEDAPALMRQITEACQQGQFEIVVHRAHGLRGLSSTFEAVPVMALTREIEHLAKMNDGSLLQFKVSELQIEFERLHAHLETVARPAKPDDSNSPSAK